ncbi:hypothetical protein GCM10027612_14100 [Microbispora bryophytorum subsp. camponoti]
MLEYAQLGWASCLGAHPLSEGGRACSCDRVGCPDPGMHPLSPAWQMQATTDTALLTRWWKQDPDANVILPTGRVFDVFDVPAAAGRPALAAMDAAGFDTGPVAENGDRVLFRGHAWGPRGRGRVVVLQPRRGTRDDRQHAGAALALPGQLRARAAVHRALGRGRELDQAPDGRPLPDPLRVLDLLADFCE